MKKSSAGHWILKTREKLKANTEPHLQIWNQHKQKRENEEYYLIPVEFYYNESAVTQVTHNLPPVGANQLVNSELHTFVKSKNKKGLSRKTTNGRFCTGQLQSTFLFYSLPTVRYRKSLFSL